MGGWPETPGRVSFQNKFGTGDVAYGARDKSDLTVDNRTLLNVVNSCMPGRPPASHDSTSLDWATVIIVFV